MTSDALPSSLAGKFAIVTGASRGIGAAIAIYLAKKGAAGIAITYLGNEAKATEVVQAINAHGAKGFAFQADILDDGIGEHVIRSSLKGLHVDHIDILVNNAGIAEAKHWQKLADTTQAGFDKMMRGNVLAPMLISRAVVPYLPESGGRVINISSIASREPSSGPGIAYAASKAGLDAITRSMAAEFASSKKATFNTVSVGPTETDGFWSVAGGAPEKMLEGIKGRMTAEKRFGTVEDVALAVGFLASGESRWINGAAIPANGGILSVAQG